MSLIYDVSMNVADVGFKSKGRPTTPIMDLGQADNKGSHAVSVVNIN